MMSKGRALELTPDENSAPVDKTTFIPLLGRIAAIGPITAEQEIEESYPLPESLVGSGDLFMLKVVGESMMRRRNLRWRFRCNPCTRRLQQR